MSVHFLANLIPNCCSRLKSFPRTLAISRGFKPLAGKWEGSLVYAIAICCNGALYRSSIIHQKVYQLLLLAGLIISSLFTAAQPLLANQPPLPKRIACPADITRLTTLMLRDLPSYTNRYIQSSRRLNREFDHYSYTLIASEAELTALPLGEYHSTEPAAASEQPQQVFFTTLERQYHDGKVWRLQEYHWLFLVQTASGWQLVTMFSSIGDYPSHNPPTPPRESSKGATGQAVMTWLRDCQAGSILDAS